MIYPAPVKTISAIRMENYLRLIEDVRREFLRDLGREPKGVELAQRLGITQVYVSQIKNGHRSVIEDDAARRIEAKCGKEIGWMDNDPSLWPFETISAERFSRLPERHKGMIEQEARRMLEDWEQSLGGAKSMA